MAKDYLHVVMLPWSAFGHMIPFFQLSKALAKAKVHVSYISTPKNIQRLPKISPDLQPFIQLVPIPLPTLDADLLPPGAEATVDVPFEKINQLKVAYDHLQQPIKQFTGDQLPDWLILDFAPHWAVEIGQDHGVPLVFFSVFSAASMSILGSPEHLSGADNRNHVLPSQESLTSPPDWMAFPSLVAYREHEAVHVHKGLFEVNGSGIRDSERFSKIISASQVLAMPSCNEFEGEYLEACQKINGKPMIPIGFLPPEKPSAKRETSSDDGSSNNVIFDWLDKQKPKSVVFIGFGSECKLRIEQVFEIAHGLALSELPFLWALRKPNWADSDADALPPGFVERTSEKGLVCLGWVAQMEILGHPSVGGSLFHSGWGSPLNARLLVEKDLAVEVKRTEEGSFCKDDIAKTLILAMVAEEGEKLRSNARKAAKVFGDHKLHQDHYIGQFVHYLEKNVTT
ncbi:putative UDP-rhamnose:rhamnosyltransferase 1 [Prunus yedoensis var. nudiflora]|uniref:Putative UDP-rhamnose:rhamnosyltransferase 1 n=1 Tax=Prunus yedoensis var. nudiflora TaxID=2094558 RepID=A0A314UDQ8_PRUYE|nr:putative UDP-rhamnose:rhamnosyltransferase 1 [Prunus yedoensis var. nudiflora]